MKYIDAERLYKKIDERMAKFAELEKETEPNDTDLSIFYQGKRKMCSEILDIITSLQQEQPDGYNRAMLEIKAKVDKLYDEASIGLNEYDSGFYNGTAETCMKLRGFIKARTSQEQPVSTCKTCGFYENNCPFIRGKLIPYPNKVCKDYTYSALKEQEQQEVELEKEMKESEQGWYNEAAEFWYKHCELNKTKDQRILILDAPTFTELVHDFYELGLNARKEETK